MLLLMKDITNKNSVSIKKYQRWFHFMCNKVRYIKITSWLKEIIHLAALKTGTQSIK